MRLTRLLDTYSELILRELASAGKGSKDSKVAFNRLFKVLTDKIHDTAKSINNGALDILENKIGQMEKLYNLKDTTYIRKLLQNNTVLNDLEQARRLVKYAKYGKYIGRGVIGINIITSYSNLTTVSEKDFGKTAFVDTGALLGSSAGAAFAGWATTTTLTALAGETLICCGPVGWGILVVGAVAGTALGYYTGSKGEKGFEWIWDNWVEPNLGSIESWLGQIGQAQIQRVKGGYY